MMLLLITTAIRVAAEICTYLFNCMFCSGICSVGSGIGCSEPPCKVSEITGNIC